MAGTCEASARGRSSAWRITAATGTWLKASKRRATDRSTACARAGGVIARVAIATSSLGLRFYGATARESRATYLAALSTPGAAISRRPFHAGGGYFSPPFPRRGRLFLAALSTPGAAISLDRTRSGSQTTACKEARRGDHRTSAHDHEQGRPARAPGGPLRADRRAVQGHEDRDRERWHRARREKHAWRPHARREPGNDHHGARRRAARGRGHCGAFRPRRP